MPRREFSAKTKAAAWERANGMCEGLIVTERSWPTPVRCNAPVDIGCFHYDHIDPVWISGSNSLTNCMVLCVPCHKLKTKTDVKNIAKVKRIHKKAAGTKKPRGRALAGTKRSGLRKKMSGEVMRR